MIVYPLRSSLLLAWLMALVLQCVSLFAQATEVILANLQAQGEQMQLELLLDQQTRYHVFTLDNPFRVVLDLEGVSLNATLKALPQQLSAQHPFLAKIRIAPYSDTITRLVFDMKGSAKPQVTDLNASQAQQQRLALLIAPMQPTAMSADKTVADKLATPSLTSSKQLEIPPANATAASNNPSPALDTTAIGESSKDVASDGTSNPSGNAQENEVRPLKKAKPGQRLITIAVDAGHGGEDPGAKGANGSHEKDITLAVAQRLKAQIDAEDNMQAILIRDGDYFVPLGDRVKKARAAKADLFISIHADSFINSTAKGSSVFALSERGATSAGARYLAKKENEVDLIGGVTLNTKDMDLARTLLDLSQTATIHDSIRLGKAVLKRIAKINSLHSNYVEQAAFAVLKAPDIPSILVETAFISNPDEEARLNDDAYQQKLVAAILGGVKAFLATNPAFAKK